MEQLKIVFRKNKNLLPLLILTLFCFHTVNAHLHGAVEIGDEFTDFALNNKHYYAFGLVVLNFIIFFLYRHAYKYLFSLILLLGLFNAINCTALESSIWFGNNGLKFQPLSFLVGLFTFILNFKKLIFYFRKDDEEQYQNNFDEELERLKVNYTRQSTEYLLQISNDSRYTGKAKTAALEVLNERGKRNE